MKDYHTLLAQVGKNKEDLFGPLALEYCQELTNKLPLRKNYLGPRAWYRLIDQLNPMEKSNRRNDSKYPNQ